MSEGRSDGKALIKSADVGVAEVRKCTKTDELDRGVRDKIHLEPGIEVGGANVSCIDGGTISTTRIVGWTRSTRHLVMVKVVQESAHHDGLRLMMVVVADKEQLSMYLS